MEPQLILTFIILIITTALFMTSRIRSDLVAMLSLLALLLTGILTVNEALSGFSNSVVVMIAALFVVSGGIFRTGLASMAGNLLLKWSNNSEIKLLFLLMLIVGILSAFMSNTGTVAVLLPVVVSIALGMKTSPAKFLIPLAFASSLGGVLTLIGTPPNIIVSQTLVDFGYERLSFFDFTPIGIVALGTGMLFLMVFRKALLPKQNSNNRVARNSYATPNQLANYYELADKLYSVYVTKGSLIAKQKLSDLKIPKKYHLYVLSIKRKTEGNGPLLLPVTYQEIAGPGSIIEENDVIFLQGSFDQVKKFAEDYALNIEESKEAKEVISREQGIAEVLLTPQSSLINHTILELHFREKYNVNILSIKRKGKIYLENLSQEKLLFGDALLVQGAWSDIELLAKETADVVVVGQPQEQASMAAANGRAPIAGLIMLAMLVTMTLEIVPAVTAVVIAAVLMVITGCLRNMDDAYGRINWESVILIAAMLPMATALEKTGGVQLLSENIVDMLGPYGPLAIMAGFYLATSFFSQFISNTATTVLFAPIAVTSAISFGVSPYPFLLAVSVAASMAFATPVASPTNALVMAAGNYKFIDFVKVGLPLQLVLWVVMMFTIPFFFPF